MKNNLCLLLLVLLVCNSCKKYVEEVIKPDAQFELLGVDATSVQADGISTLKLSVKKKVQVTETLKVTFTTSKGTLVLDGQAFIGDMASGLLKVAQDTGLYVITAKVMDGEKVVWERDTTFSLAMALPDSIGLETDKTYFNVKAESALTIKTYLSRKTGKVTTRSAVNWRAFQLNTPTDTVFVGRFKNIFNNFSSVDQVFSDVSLFTDGSEIDTLKQLYIQARAMGPNNKLLKSQLKLNYKAAD